MLMKKYIKSTQVHLTRAIQTLNNKQLQWFYSFPFEWMCFHCLMLTEFFSPGLSSSDGSLQLCVLLHRCDIWIKVLRHGHTHTLECVILFARANRNPYTNGIQFLYLCILCFCCAWIEVALSWHKRLMCLTWKVPETSDFELIRLSIRWPEI